MGHPDPDTYAERDLAERASCVVLVSIDTRQIRLGLVHEKPPVPDDEWDADAYIAHRADAYRTALEALSARIPGERFDVRIEVAGSAVVPPSAIACRASAGDRVCLVAQAGMNDLSLEALRAAVDHALAPVYGDAGAWRRHLRPAYFERHRTWRSAVGSPIQH